MTEETHAGQAALDGLKAETPMHKRTVTAATGGYLLATPSPQFQAQLDRIELKLDRLLVHFDITRAT